MNNYLINSNLNYLDPGTGSFIMQAIIAAGITIGVYFKNLKFLINNTFKKIKKIIK
jgi:hypothetical protein